MSTISGVSGAGRFVCGDEGCGSARAKRKPAEGAALRDEGGSVREMTDMMALFMTMMNTQMLMNASQQNQGLLEDI